MKRWYKVTCLKCKRAWSWDVRSPGHCPDCGSEWGEYKKRLVVLGDWRKGTKKAAPK